MSEKLLIDGIGADVNICEDGELNEVSLVENPAQRLATVDARKHLSPEEFAARKESGQEDSEDKETTDGAKSASPESSENKGGQGNQGESKMDESLKKALEGSLSPSHKEAYEALAVDKREDFLALDYAEREKMVVEATAKAEAAKKDPAVKAAEDRAEAAEKRIADLEAKARDAEIAQKAKDKGLSVTVVKALEGIEDEDERKAAYDEIGKAKAAQDYIGTTVGKSAGSDADPEIASMSPADATKRLGELEAEAAKASPNTPRSEIIKRVQSENSALVNKARSV